MRAPLVAVVAVLAVCLAGCSQQTPGDATAADATNRPTIPTGDTSTAPPPESTGSGTGSGTAALRPCDLLSSADQATFDVGPGVEEKIGSARACQWQASGRHTITVGIFDDLGLDDVVSSGATTPMKVGSHAAVQASGGVSTCAIAIGVTDSSRVDVSGVAGGDMTAACAVAKQAAELVEPKLP